MFGGIPWNCYFQRVLSCRTPRDAKGQSILAGVLTIVLTIPPLMMGVAAFAVSFVLRVGGGEPLLGLPALIAYPDTVPFRTLAAAAGLVLLPVVSRATTPWDAPRPLHHAALPAPI